MRFDEIGYWSEVKLDIVREYASAYSTIVSAQKNPPLYHIYIDAFAGAGIHVSRQSGEFVAGSPLNALLIRPPFREYHFIDLDTQKVDALTAMVGGRKDVHIHKGDCNPLLLSNIFPQARYEDYRRALCLLDPYGLDLDWKVIETAGQMRSVEIFLNFQVVDMHRNILWLHPEHVDSSQVDRLNRYWGDDSWRSVAYESEPGLFGTLERKASSQAIAEGFRRRLKKVAGFTKVPRPIPMRNSKGNIVYYLFFASHKPVAEDIVTQIFNKYRERGAG